jgi:hypothetical protein
MAAAAPAAAGASKSGGTLLKILLAFVVVIFLFAAAGMAGIWYVGHRIKLKAHEMGLDQISNANSGPVLGGTDPCSLLSKDDVSQAVKMPVVRAEQVSAQNEGCQYSVTGNYPDMVATHLSLLQQSMMKDQKQPMTDEQKQQMDQLIKSFFHGMDTQQGSPSQHPGEAPVFQFGVSNTGAKAAMSMTRLAFGRMGPAFTELPGIGDEAFDVGGALILARKGDNVVQVLYMMCPCGRDDAASLVKKIVANM